MFSCIYVFSLRLSAQPAKNNSTLVAMNFQHLNPHFYCPLAGARTLDRRSQFMADTEKAYEQSDMAWQEASGAGRKV